MEKWSFVVYSQQGSKIFLKSRYPLGIWANNICQRSVYLKIEGHLWTNMKRGEYRLKINDANRENGGVHI